MGPEIFRQLRNLARRLPWACALAAGPLALAAFPAQAQVADSEIARTEATIVNPGSIVKINDMRFGQVTTGATAGTVTISPAASATCATTGGIVHTGACQAARFTIYGKRNWNVRIKNTAGGTITLTNPGGATMTINNVTIGPVGMTPQTGGAGWNLGTYKINTASGITDFYLGGRLNVNAMQAPGHYTGTINVQIQFN